MVVAAIGNFDGVHRGHRALIGETWRLAQKLCAPTGVVLFEPHPRRYFRPDDPPFLITTPTERDGLLRDAGVSRIMPLTFDAAMVAMDPRDFVRDILAGELALSGVLTGADFRFGRARSGDADLLCRAGRPLGITVEIVDLLKPASALDGGKIGSTRIREAISKGDMPLATRMLGHPWFVRETVQPGQQLGRTLGFPTANLVLGPRIEPAHGVYAVTALHDGTIWPAIANFGRRPTVGEGPPWLEVHLFDFSGDLYGATLEVAFHGFIRPEERFDGLEALKAQIAKDCETARQMLAAADVLGAGRGPGAS